MAIDRLVEEIKKLSPKQKEELFRKLGITFPANEHNPLLGIIGIAKNCPEDGAEKHDRYLYGRP